MTTTWLLVSFLILPFPGGSCSDSPRELAWAAQPPEPDQPTPPAAPTPAPGEPTDPPVLEDPTPEPDPGMPTPDPEAPCCFSHPHYAGACSVTPVEDETCASILGYLNDQMSAGKSYCNYTDLRGGWKPIQCRAR